MFGFLWRKQEATIEEYDISNLDEETLLEYEEEEEETQESMLCGTQSLLEMECIPQEAYSMARFHLGSVKTHRDIPNVARSFGVPIVIIVDVGVVVDLEENARMECSDKEDIEEYIASLDGRYDASYARAVTIGNDLLLVSWGLSDGIVVVYRRIATVGWESVAMLSPTSAVLDNLQVSPAQREEGVIASSLLCVTDMVPMMVEDPDGGTPVVTLAVSRLGGYIELIILPAGLWTGPIPKSTRRKRKRRNKPTEHYANGKLHNLCAAAEVGVAALTTSEYHVDVLCLEVYRTKVGSDTEWDDAFPKPPAEYVMVASGTKNGHHKVSFWGISTMFPETPTEDQRVSLHVSFIDALDIVGTEVTVFTSPTMLNYWRKARRVWLRQREADHHIVDEDMDETDETHEILCANHSADTEVNLESRVPLSTLSAPVPIVRMRLTSKAESEESKPVVLLAVLDGNGGVIIIDCTTAIGVAEHAVAKELLLHEPALSLSCRLPPLAETFVDIEWLHGELVVVKPRAVQVLKLSVRRQSEATDPVRIAHLSYSLDVPTMARGAAVIETTHSGGFSFVAFRKAQRKRRILCYGTLQILGSSTVIDMLVKSSKFAEAISSAEAMNVPGSTESIQLCHKRLWEREWDVRHLSAVTDDEYVVKEALSIFRDDESRAAIDLSIAREALLAAIRRVSIHPVDDSLEEIEELATKISTYILLCMSQGAQPLLVRFREKFLPASLSQMAGEFASKGNISALTIVLFRHRRELLQCLLDILDKIPLETPPAAYSHLLPVSKQEGDGSFYFYQGGQQNGGLRKWSLMAEDGDSMLGTKLLMDDDDDKELISNRFRTPDGSSVDMASGTYQKWYLTRANRIQRAIGSVSFLRDFCECALQRLGVLLSSKSGEESDPEILELYSLYTFAIQLDGMMIDASTTSCSAKLSMNALAVMNMSDIKKLSVEDRVSLMLGLPDNNSMDVPAKLRTGYAFLSLGESTEPGHLERTIDHAVSAYCQKALLNSMTIAENRDIPCPQQADGLRYALGLCTTIANASRSTIRRSKRVVKDMATLTNLVIDAAYNASRACKVITLLPSDCRYVIDSIWESYECLPTRFAPNDASQSNFISVQTETDRLYQNLVAVDILSRWSSSAALGYLIDLHNTENLDSSRSAVTDPGGQTQRVNVGVSVLTEICRSFCHQVSTVKYASASKEERGLLNDLISDVDQLDKVGFEGSLPLATTLQEGLIKHLLLQEKCDLIAPLANWVGRDQVQATVLTFVNEAMFSDDKLMASMSEMAKGDRVQAAIKCQDILGPLFPGLGSAFESIRRYFDAASFVTSLLPANEFAYPYEVRDQPPLDIIESLMARHPPCILEGCSDWAQRALSEKANGVVCDHYCSMRERNGNAFSHGRDRELPVLPGTAIYHLASLLGLEEQRSFLVVKARVVHHAVLGRFYAAAAAVCATMIYESGNLWDNPAVAQCIADSVAKVVSVNDYDDVRMKGALCSGVFKYHRSNLSVLDSPAYEMVLDAFISLESEMNSFRRPQEPTLVSPSSDGRVGTSAPSGSDFLVFRAAGMVAKTAQTFARHAHVPANQSMPGGTLQPHRHGVTPPSLIERVYHGILSDYSTDIHSLFSILRDVSTANRVDDPLLLTLGRFMVFWCISDALSMRLQHVSPEPHRADFKDVLALGTSLLLHSQGEESLISCISELRGIVKKEAATAMERAAACAQPTSVTPDPDIVRRLISRGYSENGARRSAIMTGNESPEVALVWAVSHTLDYGFDDPVVFLASLDGSSSPRRVDQHMIHQLQDTLNLTTNYLSRKQTLNSLLPTRQAPERQLANAQKRRIGSKDTNRNGSAQNRVEPGNGQTRSPTSLSSKLHGRRQSENSPRHVRTLGSPVIAKPKAVAVGKTSTPVTTTTKSSRPSASMKPAVVPRGNQLPNSGHQGIRDGRSVGPSAAKPTLVVSPFIPESGTAALHGHRQSEKLPSRARTLGSPIDAKPEAAAVTKASGHVTTTSSSGQSASIKPAAVTRSNQLSKSGHERIGDERSVGSPAENPTPVVPPNIPKSGTTTAACSSGGLVSSTTSPQVTAAHSSLGWKQHTKSASTELASEERRRLAAEGRRMLQQARASRGATKIPSPSTERPAASSRVGRYPLRSRLAVSGSRTSNEEKATAPTVASIIADVPDPVPSENADQDDSADGWDFDDF
jgi:hypothetical protein